MRDNLSILLSTCDHYLPIAEWTVSCIQKQWNTHPPIALCGLSGDPTSPIDPTDWMSLTLEGVKAARRTGIQWTYLILDDLPPVGRCSANILNDALPELAEELHAVNIGLLGWGQRRSAGGVSLGKQKKHLMRNHPDYRWKFSLHPTLWNAAALQELLEIRISQFAPGQRTPWNFERHPDKIGGPVPRRLLENTYRIHGGTMTAGSRIFGTLWQASLLAAFDAGRFLLRIAGGQEKRDTFDRNHLWAYQYYRGPYPILWSGAVRQGKPNKSFEGFLRFTGRRRMREEWRSVQKQFSKAC